MDELLESWDISQDTIAVFRDNNIDMTCLDGIGDEELMLLIPQKNIRDRIKFKMGMKKYNQEIDVVNSNTDSTETASLSSCDIFLEDNKNKIELNLREILQDNMQGRLALQAINKKKLDTMARNNLVQSVVDYYIKTHSKMCKADFDAVANEIVLLCPKECKETYYVPSRTISLNKTLPAKGKLVDRYYNQMRKLRTSGVLPKKRKGSTKTYSSDDETSEDDSSQEIQKWLKVNRDPWPVVEEKWRESSSFRRKKTYEDENIKLSNIMNDWPCLKCANGHRLIDIDFTYIYPQKTSKLFEKWDDFKEKFLKICDNREIEIDNDNCTDLAICGFLPYKIKPTSKVLKTTDEKKKYNKVSIAESKEAFIMIVKNNADILEGLQNRIKSYDKKGLTCQPIIVCVGTTAKPEQFYVVIDDLKYRFDSLIKAIDICFKCFMVLNLAYPKECEQIWLFIQNYFYEIYLPNQRKFSQVTTFITELNGE